MMQNDWTRMDVDDFVDQVQSKEDFDNFLSLLLKDYRKNHSEWGNDTLPAWLKGMAAFSGSVELYLQNANIPLSATEPSWRLFAEILLAGRVYDND